MTEQVKRYNMNVGKFGNVHHYESEHGRWVKRDDYACLEQECERLRKQVKMLVNQHMPLKPIEGLDGWSEVISATKAIELRDAALKLLARCQEKLDPHRDAVLWGEVCDAFKVKPCQHIPLTSQYGTWCELCETKLD